MIRTKIIIGSALAMVTIVAVYFYINIGQYLIRNTTEHQEDLENWISTKNGSLHIQTFKSNILSDSVNLVFVIHGDAPFNKPSYHYLMAKRISEGSKNTVAIGILRPGYTDPDNNTSNGVRGITNGDNYTQENIEAIEEVIEKLKMYYGSGKTLIIGHSGGSAITANLIALYPGIANAAVLVSCPCNVPKFRESMKKFQNNSMWNWKVKSISPIEVAEKIDKKTEVVLVVGEKDELTPITLSQEYFEKLKSLGVKSNLISIPNEGHEILLSDPVLEEIKKLLE